MNEISIINDGWILIEDGLIDDFGNMETSRFVLSSHRSRDDFHEGAPK